MRTNDDNKISERLENLRNRFSSAPTLTINNSLQKEWEDFPLYSGKYLLYSGLSNDLIKDAGIRVDYYGNALFPHLDENYEISGWEIKNISFTSFNGKKGLMILQFDERSIEVKKIFISDSAISVLSFAQEEHQPGNIYVSHAGNISEKQTQLLNQLFSRHKSSEIYLLYKNEKHWQLFSQRIQSAAPDRVMHLKFKTLEDSSSEECSNTEVKSTSERQAH